MRPYWAILSARFRTLLQYRAAAAAGVGTQFFWGLIRVMIFEAFYRSSSAPQPMTLDEVTTYVWLGQALLLMMPFRADDDIREMIRSGTVAYELVRPLDLYMHWFCRAVAARTAPTILRAPPIFALSLPWLGMKLPPSIGSAVAWILTMFGGLLVTSAITTLLEISMLWTISGQGINRLLPSVAFVLSGAIVPVPLFPDWAQRIMNALPFRGIVDAPFRVYMGHIPPNEIGAVLLHQIAWATALILFGRWLLGRGIKRLVVQGG